MSTVQQNATGEVRGDVIQVCLDGVMAVFQSRIRNMLDEEGIEKPDPYPDEWYPIANFLEVLTAVETNTGENALRKIGEATPRFADWPGDPDSPGAGLDAIGSVYETAHRDVSGTYNCDVEGDEATVTSTTPYPQAWEIGFLKGTAEHFGARYARVDVAETESDKRVYTVTW